MGLVSDLRHTSSEPAHTVVYGHGPVLAKRSTPDGKVEDLHHDVSSCDINGNELHVEVLWQIERQPVIHDE